MGKKNRHGGGSLKTAMSAMEIDESPSDLPLKRSESIFYLSVDGAIYVNSEGVYELATADDFEVKMTEQGNQKEYGCSGPREEKCRRTRMQGQYGATKKIKP